VEFHDTLLVHELLEQLVLLSRGSARRLAMAACEQFPHFLTLGMPAGVALRETMDTVIHMARVAMRYSVGVERHALEDFITMCLQARDTAPLQGDRKPFSSVG